jgi:hypothetical protein
VPDLRTFRRVCYEAARATGGEVTEFRVSDGRTPNFHQGLIAYRVRTVAVVCSRDTPLLAIAVPASSRSRRRRGTAPCRAVRTRRAAR